MVLQKPALAVLVFESPHSVVQLRVELGCIVPSSALSFPIACVSISVFKSNHGVIISGAES